MRRALLLLLVASAACSGDPEPIDNTPADSGVAANPDAAAQEDATVPACTELVVFADSDGDDYGIATSTRAACLAPGEEEPGYSRQTGDCLPTDPWANPSAAEICGDF